MCSRRCCSDAYHGGWQVAKVSQQMPASSRPMSIELGARWRARPLRRLHQLPDRSGCRNRHGRAFHTGTSHSRSGFDQDDGGQAAPSGHSKAQPVQHLQHHPSARPPQSPSGCMVPGERNLCSAAMIFEGWGAHRQAGTWQTSCSIVATRTRNTPMWRGHHGQASLLRSGKPLFWQDYRDTIS
jgi:hypothetical protein